MMIPVSKTQFIHQLKEKFVAIQKMKSAGQFAVHAELAFHPQANNMSCILRSRTRNIESQKVLLRIEAAEESMIPCYRGRNPFRKITKKSKQLQ